MGAQGVQREAERLRHGDKTAAEAAMLQAQTGGARGDAGDGAKSFDGCYAQADLQHPLANTSGLAESFLGI